MNEYRENMQRVFDVKLPDWSGEGTVSVRLRRPSLLTMAAQGDIPNELLGAAQRLFDGEPPTALPVAEMGRMMVAVAKAALVEPTYEQLCADGGSLTDIQLAAVYGFSQAGVRALLPFRDDPAGAEPAGDVEAVRHDAG